MSFKVEGLPLERPPKEFSTLDFLTQASPVDVAGVDLVLDPKDV